MMNRDTGVIHRTQNRNTGVINRIATPVSKTESPVSFVCE